MAPIFSTSIENDKNDRLNHFFTTIILFACVIVSSKRQYIGSPISCWVPKEFTKAHKEYTENICWVKSTYFVPAHEDIPDHVPHRSKTELNYYQWIPMLLLIQAILFQIPNLFWNIFRNESGINVHHVLSTLCSIDNANYLHRKKAVKQVVRHIEEAIHLQRNQVHNRITKFMFCSRRAGNFLTYLYLSIKLFYIGNIVFQFFLMNTYLHGTSPLYGVELAYNLSIGKSWEETGHFPRVTICDFEIRVLGNIQRHSIQCVLQINRLNDKIFAFLWFWLVGLGLLTVWSWLTWVAKTQLLFRRVGYVKQLLEYNGTLQPGCNYAQVKRHVTKFVMHGLRQDGVFVLLLIDHNAGPLVTTEVACRLWNRYMQDSKFKQENTDWMLQLPPPRPPRKKEKEKLQQMLDKDKEDAATAWESDDQV